MTTVFSIISGKGGTGKSTVCAALSKSLAKMGKKVLAVDLDIGLRSLDLMFSLESKVVFDLGDVISKKCEPKAAIVAHDNIRDLYLLCGPRTISKEFSVKELLRILSDIIKVCSYDYVLLDLPAGLGFSVLAAKELSDFCIAVTLPEPIAIRDTSTLVRIISGFDKPTKLIINRVSEPMIAQSGLSDLDEVIDKIGAQLIGVLPEDPWINSPLSVKKKGKTPSVKDIFEAIAQRIVGKDTPLLFKNF